MKTKRIVARVIGMSLAAAAFPEETDVSIPSLDHVAEINIYSYPAWHGVIYPNGSAELKYGSSFLIWGAAPKGSFLFEDLYHLLAPRLTKKRTGSKFITVSLPIAGQTSITSFYFYGEEEIRAIMRGFCDKVAVPCKTQFEELLREYPLVPGDEPESGETPPPRTPEEQAADQKAFAAAMEDTPKGTYAKTLLDEMTKKWQANAVQAAPGTASGGGAQTPPPSREGPDAQPPGGPAEDKGAPWKWPPLVGLATAIGAMAAWLRLRKK